MAANTRFSLKMVALLLVILVLIQLVAGENATEGELSRCSASSSPHRQEGTCCVPQSVLLNAIFRIVGQLTAAYSLKTRYLCDAAVGLQL